MYQIVLTGGIGSGKTAVANMLKEHGAYIIDYDELAREAVEPGSQALEEIKKHWGSAVTKKDGTLNRPALASIVFESPGDLAALNAITHPKVQELAAERAARLIREDSTGVLVHDIPLIDVDSPLVENADLVLVVEAPIEARVDRLATNRGMPVDEAYARIDAQPDDFEREKMADVLIRNDGNLAQLRKRVDKFWENLIGEWG